MTTKDGGETRGISSSWLSERRLGEHLNVRIKDLFTSVFDAKRILADIDGQTETVLPGEVSVVDSDGSIAAGSPLHSACLGARPRWIRTPILSVGYPEIHIIGFGFDALDCLGGVRDVSVVDKSTVPDEE